MIGQTISHYHIIEQLGEGGMGVVYVAEDTHLGRRVAIKFPSATMNGEQTPHGRFLREARSISSLSHPHIATLFDYGETSEGQPFIVMELVTGQELGELLRAGLLSLTRACEIIEDVAEALGEAHRSGIIHRDVKPSNVIINERGEVKVLDFGLAKLIGDDRELDPNADTMLGIKTRSDMMLGTPLYLSPEQAKGLSVDGRSDLFALGALLYECIAGRPAFSGTTVLEIAAQIIHIMPPPPSQFNQRVPPELDRITLKALAKNADERYQTAGELIADLRAVRAQFTTMDQLGTTQRLPHTSESPQRSGALTTLSDNLRRPRLSIGTALLSMMLVLGGIWGLSRWLRPTPHQPSPEAKRWDDLGAGFLRDGAYYQASKALEHAVESDGKYVLAHARLAEACTELDYMDKAKDELLQVGMLAPDRSVLSKSDALYLDAITATATRDYQRAVNAYREIVKLMPDQPQAYVDLGRAYEKNDDTKQAIESYIEATNRDSQYATAYLRLGVLYGRRQDFASAASALDKAEAIYRDSVNIEGRAEVLYQRGYLDSDGGRIPEARTQLEQALKLAESTSNQPQRIKVLLELSIIEFTANNIAQAQQYAREAIETAQANSMEHLTARGLIDLGTVFFVRGDYSEAEKYYMQGLEFAQRYGARRSEAGALINLGSLRIQQSQPDEAINYINRALPFYQEGNYRREVSQAQSLLGRANRMRGNYEAALQAFEGQLQLAEQRGDQSQTAFAHEGIGSVQALQERWPEALSHFEQKFLISRALSNQKGMGYGLVERGKVLWQLGRYDEARGLLDQARALADRPDGGYKELLVSVYVSYAEMALSERRFAEAKTQAERALTLADPKYTDSIIGAKRVVCLAQALSGAVREGRRQCEEAVEMATRSGDQSLVSGATLALAQAMLESGDAQGALTTALQMQEKFSQTGQLASEWRAWALASRASQRAGNMNQAHEYAARAAASLAKLQQKWGSDIYNKYLIRPDVQSDQKQLTASS